MVTSFVTPCSKRPTSCVCSDWLRRGTGNCWPTSQTDRGAGATRACFVCVHDGNVVASTRSPILFTDSGAATQERNDSANFAGCHRHVWGGIRNGLGDLFSFVSRTNPSRCPPARPNPAAQLSPSTRNGVALILILSRAGPRRSRFHSLSLHQMKRWACDNAGNMFWKDLVEGWSGAIPHAQLLQVRVQAVHCVVGEVLGAEPPSLESVAVMASRKKMSLRWRPLGR